MADDERSVEPEGEGRAPGKLEIERPEPADPEVLGLIDATDPLERAEDAPEETEPPRRPPDAR